MITCPTIKSLPASPFSDRYWKAEIKAYGLPRGKGHKGDAMRVDWPVLDGRCDDYLNTNFRNCKTRFPRLLMGEGGNQRTWMSLTPMEIQSGALPIHRAQGKVVVGGLGLGYVAVRMAAKPEVQQVVVYEISPENIQWFKTAFKGRPELEKIEIRQGDMRQLFKKQSADFVYVDIYADMLPDATLHDARLFMGSNKIKRYHYWGYERVLVNVLCYPHLRHYRDRLFFYNGSMASLGRDFRSFLGYWMRHKVDKCLATDLSTAALDMEICTELTEQLLPCKPL